MFQLLVEIILNVECCARRFLMFRQQADIELFVSLSAVVVFIDAFTARSFPVVT